MASSFPRCLYLPSVSTRSPFAAGWTVSECPTIGSGWVPNPSALTAMLIAHSIAVRGEKLCMNVKERVYSIATKFSIGVWVGKPSYSVSLASIIHDFTLCLSFGYYSMLISSTARLRRRVSLSITLEILITLQLNIIS